MPRAYHPAPAARLAGGLAGACLGLLAGQALALLAQHWLWLEMRVNTGLLLPLGLGLGGLAGPWGRRWLAPRRLLLIQAGLLALAAALLGFDPQALLVVPASLLREGCHLAGASLASLNWLLLAGLLATNLACFSLMLGRPAPVKQKDA